MKFCAYVRRYAGLIPKKATGRQQTASGFTITELMVVVSIILLITAVALYSNEDRSDQLQLRHAADLLSLKLREAQIFGLAVREAYGAGLAGNDRFEAGYGVHFDAVNQQDRYTLFYDVPGCKTGTDAGYHPGSPCGTNENRDVVTLQNGMTIDELCITHSSVGGAGPLSSLSTCMNGTGYQVEAADVVFERPNPDAAFYLPECNACYSADVQKNITGLYIYLASPDDRISVVHVTDNGAISMQSNL